MAYRPVNPQQTAAFLRQKEQSRNSNRYFGGMKASSAAHGFAGASGKIGDIGKRQARKAASRAKWGTGLGIAKLVATIVNPYLGAAVGLATKATQKSKTENPRTKKLVEERAMYRKQLGEATKDSRHISGAAKQGISRIMGESQRETAESNRYIAKKMKTAKDWQNVGSIASTAAGALSLYRGWQALGADSALAPMSPESILDQYEKGIYYA